MWHSLKTQSLLFLLLSHCSFSAPEFDANIPLNPILDSPIIAAACKHCCFCYQHFSVDVQENLTDGWIVKKVAFSEHGLAPCQANGFRCSAEYNSAIRRDDEQWNTNKGTMTGGDESIVFVIIDPLSKVPLVRWSCWLLLDSAKTFW